MLLLAMALLTHYAASLSLMSLRIAFVHVATPDCRLDDERAQAQNRRSIEEDARDCNGEPLVLRRSGASGKVLLHGSVMELVTSAGAECADSAECENLAARHQHR